MCALKSFWENSRARVIDDRAVRIESEFEFSEFVVEGRFEKIDKGDFKNETRSWKCAGYLDLAKAKYGVDVRDYDKV